jgi:hypothetical protein
MKRWRGSWTLLVVLLMILIATLIYGSLRKGNQRVALLGVPDSAASLIFKYVLKEKLNEQSFLLMQLESYPLKDCCSVTTQWALSSGALDMAVMCPAAAKRFIDKNSSYIIVGPVLKNSDVFVMHQTSYNHPVKVAVSAHREHQRTMVEKRYEAKGCPTTMLHSGIPYAYAREVVDGAVVDIIKSYHLKGITLKADENNTDFITYVLVCKRTFQNTSLFKTFLNTFDEAVEEMNDFNKLFYLMKTYESKEITKENAQQWKTLNIKFLHPLSNYPFE